VVSVSARGLLAVGAALVVGWALVSAAGAILVLFAALFGTLVLDPPVTALAGRTGMSRGRSALLVVAAVVVACVVLVIALVAPLVRELQDMVQALPQVVADIRQSDAFHWLDQRVDLGAELQAHAGDLAARVPDTLEAFLGLAGHVFSVGLLLFELVFLTLFLLCDLPQIVRAIESVLYPESASRFGRLRTQITATVSRYAIGALLIAAIAGSTMGLTAWILGAPYPLALALISGLLDLIPQVGATLAGVILVLVTIPQGIPQALVMLAVVLIYQQVENYVLQPTIQGRAAQVSAFVVLASVVVFGALLGVLGALVAVPVAASGQIVMRELTAERRARVAALAPVGEQA
jgi:predicted PurR-regulated permease PerM